MLLNLSFSKTKCLNNLWPLFVFFLVFGALFNNLVKVVSLPNVFTFARLATLLTIVFLTKKKALINNSFFYLFVSFFFVSYLSISFLDDRIWFGLYYIRIYLEVFLVFYISQFIHFNIHFKTLIHSIFNIAALSSIISIYSLFLFYSKSDFIYLFHASREINYNWFLGIGKFIYRAGFPIGGPNQLGLFYAVIIILSMNFRILSKKKRIIYSILFFVGLISAFSKSAFLVLIIYFSIKNFNKFSKIFYAIPFSIFVIFILLELDAKFLEGRLIGYVENLFSNKDGSTGGHINSLFSAINNFEEYSLAGYEKGTVGPKGRLFTNNYKNVESSFFLVLYDMGMVIGFFYFSAMIALLKSSFLNKNQFVFLVSVLPVYCFLPIIHSIEITSFVCVSYVILGFNLNEKQLHA